MRGIHSLTNAPVEGITADFQRLPINTSWFMSGL
jgi:hypothetical protein